MNSDGVSPGRLVLGINPGPEREGRNVERDSHVGRVFLLQQSQEHRNEPVDGIGVLTIRRDKTVNRERVKGPECQRVTVNHHQGRLVTHSLSLQVGNRAQERR